MSLKNSLILKTKARKINLRKFKKIRILLIINQKNSQKIDY